MIDYGKVRAIQQLRFGESGEHRDRRRRKRQYKPLSELLGALAGGLASIGIRRKGESRPAGPAY
ncbi:MAG TPA: hypothetical protein VMM14_07025 [Acidimicrobiia bacterium]|nr:hypothetical protein [Acidimicrobiia bacterium]